MPTYFAETRFLNDYRRLSADKREQFRKARKEFTHILQEWEEAGNPGVPRFPKHLGIKPMVHHRQIMEFAWSPDGRCTWRYGASVRPGKFHVVWRRIGSHDIYQDP